MEWIADHLAVPFVCVTLGERGCSTWHDAETAAYPAVATEPVDATGGSDTFIATLAFHLDASTMPAAAIRRALAAAASTISQAGGYDALPGAAL